MAIDTKWMPERGKVGWHADSFFRCLTGMVDADDETGERDALLVSYGSTEAGLKFILETQGREAALALIEAYAGAIRQQPAPANMNEPSAPRVLQ